MPACRGCARQLPYEDMSSDDNRMCPTCGDLVYAVRPNEEDGRWYPVDLGHDGRPLEGNFITSAPCLRCERTDFQVRRVNRYEWEACCCGSPGDVSDRGCGAIHPIRQKPGREVVEIPAGAAE